MKDELLAPEGRNEELSRILDDAPTRIPCLHPRLADLYREKIDRLHEKLNRPEFRAEATEVIRSIIDEVKLVPENGTLGIELAGLLALTAGSKKPATIARDGLPVTLVAGTRDQLCRRTPR
jgi:site-specific DNA recombinase